MKYNVLKASFLPKFTIENEKYNKTFLLDSVYGLHLGIMCDVTGNLGYNKIRKSRKTNITIDELYSHLREMDEKTQHNRDRISKSFTSGLIRLWDEETNYLNKCNGRIDEIKIELGNVLTKDDFESVILEYKSQLKQKDAEIKRLKEKGGKKSLLSRVFSRFIEQGVLN
jgi:hypothetical protein